MFILLLAVIVGLAFSYFAVQNTAGVTVHFMQYTVPKVPLYLVAMFSLLVGRFISWLLSLVNGLFSALELFGKDRALKQSVQTHSQLQERVHKLEVENARLKGEEAVDEQIDEPHFEEKEVQVERPNFFSRIRHQFS